MENETALFCAGLIATKLIAYIVLDRDGSSNRSFTRFRTDDWTNKDLFAVSLAGCDRCAPRIKSAETERSPSLQLHAAVVFEQALSVHPAKPRGGASVEDLEKLYKELASQSKVLRNCIQLPLDRSPAALPGNLLKLLREPSANPEATLSAAKLAALLTLTAGIRHRGTPERPVRRWAASGGNLGSVELFLVTRGVAGLSAGTFFYQPKQHTLARLERWVEPFSVEEAIHLLTPAAPDAQAVIVFTSALSRLKSKYGPFAYKLSNLDTGVAIAQMHLVARSLGLWSQTQTLWPDDVAESMCALSAKHERVTAVVALSGVRTNTLTSAGVRKYRLAIANETAMSEISCLGTDDLLDHLCAQSRTVQASLITTSAAPGGRDAPEIEHFERLVPPNIMHTLSIGAVLTGRRSVRSFSSSPVQLEQIGTLLYNANASDSINWPSEDTDDRSLVFFLAAKRVEGLTPALYRFDARDHMLHAASALPTPNQEKIFFRGHDYSSSAFFVWICGNLQAACDSQGAFGYRSLLLRAGAAGNSMWLSALALNLGGSLIAGIDSNAGGLPRTAPYYAGLLGFIGGVSGVS
ncbi:SagB-type dehydrogenase family enzyme [Granulicella aggregans]|uniref:SagB-type dehydrogenase family enzyme n=1 Tax=Granulicella aggregans TaxID=474949 RepID=A0A7W8E6C6_9BACT|nr:SagB family peptide dehydrogenase [Granulicella aggregans]MBB5061068.1 SagB-type dehydrogenase family enzyme [Granulicella aggregans]